MNYYGKKIITSNELKILWGVDGNSFKKRLSYNIKNSKLTKLRKGLYVFTNQIDNLTYEDFWTIANSIYSPSYISFETVLNKEGINFQYYSSIFVASRYTKQIKIKKIDLNINLKKLPDGLLLNPIGIEKISGYDIATPERAICDVLFKYPNYYFDNLDGINKKKILEIAEIFDNYKKGFYQNIYNLIKKYE